MNKLFIGLLIVAAGTGAFFLLRKKKTTDANKINKEWIIGKWETDAVIPGDSTFRLFRYEFQKEGNILRSLNDSAKADTTHYEWNKKNDLVWSKKPGDSTGRIYSVIKLTTDSLQVRSEDSTMILFTKVK